MTVQQLQNFIKLAETLHFTKAAEELFISQPNLSSSIRSLEEELNTVLFEREKKKTRLTNTGKLFYPYACRMIDTLIEAKRRLADDQKILSGKVTIACTYSICQYWIPDCLRSFYSNPNHRNILIQLQPKVTNTEIIKDIQNGSMDFIISYATGGVMESYPIFKQDIVLALPETHPLAAQERLAFSEVANEPFVVGLEDGYARKRLRDMFAYCAVPERIAVEAGGDIITLLTYVSLGFGIALVPKTPIEMPNVVYRSLDHPINYNQLYLSNIKDRELSVTAQYVKNFLLDYALKNPAKMSL